MVFAIAFCGLASMFPNRAAVFLFFALCFSKSVLNGLFHVGATAFSGVYFPCLITALVLYNPLLWYLIQVATDARKPSEGQALGGVRRTPSLQGNTPRSGLGGSVNIAMNSSKLLSGSRK